MRVRIGSARRPVRPGPPRLLVALLVAAVLAVGACNGSPILANAPVVRPSPAPTPSPTARPSDPRPLTFPADDGPHHRLTEWWYYTGHLHDAAGATYGFEFVIFRAERGDFPTAWASHLALTDEAGNRFVYAQRSEIGPQVDRSPTSGGFDLAMTGLDPSRPQATPGIPWQMRGGNGNDHLTAALTPAEAAAQGQSESFGLDLSLTSQAPPVLHGGIGWIDFGPAGSSYYYSRPRMMVNGALTLDGRTVQVDGDAWFDHQWGDFIAAGAGGWDWFAVNLDDGTDLMLSLIRDASGAYPLMYGTLVHPNGSVEDLPSSAFSVTVTGHWTSPATGTTYPAGWQIAVPGAGLQIGLRPTVADQELNTRATTGVVYWEGSQHVTASRRGVPLGGQAYVELTGYVPSDR